MSQKTLYLKLNEISEVHDKNVYLKDVAELYSEDKTVLAKCSALKIRTVPADKDMRYVDQVLTVLQKIAELDPDISVTNLGETDFIIDYQKEKPPHLIWQWLKTLCVCFICFSGAAFAIMTFNNDANVQDVFQKIYEFVIGQEPEGVTILEWSYSVGLSVGILVFFNHFAKWKLTTDPTPLEVEMRLYEDNVSKTLIQNHGRKESGIDVT